MYIYFLHLLNSKWYIYTHLGFEDQKHGQGVVKAA